MINVGLIYLGRRGGGALLANQIVEDGLNKGVNYASITYHSENLYIEEIVDANCLIIFRELRGILGYIIRPLSICILALRVCSHLRKKSISTVLFPMMSPFDLILARILRRAGFKVIRVIHDAHPHLGERWPTPRAIRRVIAQSDEVLVFSNFVKSQLNLPNSIVVDYPKYVARRSQYSKNPGQICLVGRKAKYKGFDLGVSAFWQMRTMGISLIIAGQAAEDFVDLIYQENISVIPGWLTDVELERVIAESEVLLLPYLEASQSGLIDIAKSFDTFVVATPTGGLQEQIGGINYGLISSSIDAQSIAESVDYFFSTRIGLVSVNQGERMQINDFLLLDGYSRK